MVCLSSGLAVQAAQLSKIRAPPLPIISWKTPKNTMLRPSKQISTYYVRSTLARREFYCTGYP